MNKKNMARIEVTELDLHPISDEDLNLVKAAQETNTSCGGGGGGGGGGGDDDDCESWWCFWYVEEN